MSKILLAVLLALSFGLSTAKAADPGAKKLYDAKCAKCHGADGKGSEKMAKMLKLENDKLSLVGPSTAKAADADLVKVTTEGKKKMPKFDGKITKAEIEGLIRYIRTFAGGKK